MRVSADAEFGQGMPDSDLPKAIVEKKLDSDSDHLIEFFHGQPLWSAYVSHPCTGDTSVPCRWANRI